MTAAGFADGSLLVEASAVDAEACVVGSGAGGSMLAHELARAGVDVLVLEAGPDLQPRDMNQLEGEMLPKLYRRDGAFATQDRAVTLVAGRGLGGSTLHNLSLCKRAPDAVFDSWVLAGLDASSTDLDEHYEAVERLLEVQPIPEGMINRNNELFRTGVEALGYRGGILHHNRRHCIGAGFCELGCTFDRKLNGRKVLLPAAAAAGARIHGRCRVDRIVLDARNRVRGLAATALDADGAAVGTFRVRARVVCLCAGAVGSAAIALRSGIPDPFDRIGRGLRIHPGSLTAGLFDELVEAWTGIPQSWECTEWLDPSPDSRRRVWLLPGSAHPITAAVMIPGAGAEHAAWMARFPYLAASVAMVHDHTSGRVTVDARGRAQVHYWPDQSDLEQLALGLRQLTKIHLAAGARLVLLPFDPPMTIGDAAEVARIDTQLFRRHSLIVAGVHLQGGMAMGGEPSLGVTDYSGAVFSAPGLFVADGGVFPTSIGVPPQLSIYATARRIAASVAAAAQQGAPT